MRGSSLHLLMVSDITRAYIIAGLAVCFADVQVLHVMNEMKNPGSPCSSVHVQGERGSGRTRFLNKLSGTLPAALKKLAELPEKSFDALKVTFTAARTLFVGVHACNLLTRAVNTKNGSMLSLMPTVQLSKGILCVNMDCQEIMKENSSELDCQELDTRLGFWVASTQLLKVKRPDIMR